MKKKFNQAATVTLFFVVTFIAILSCRKEQLKVPVDNLSTVHEDIQNATQKTIISPALRKQAYLDSANSAAESYDLTAKVNSVFPIGITKIQQFKSGASLGIEKSKIAQKLVVIISGKTYYPPQPSLYRVGVKIFRVFPLNGILHIFFEVGNCDYYINIDEKTGDVVSGEIWCS